ncbi:MAG: aldo/keto reductase [Paludibaculum sp.]
MTPVRFGGNGRHLIFFQGEADAVSHAGPHRHQGQPLCARRRCFGKLGNPDHEDGARIIHRAIDAGINFIDTADRYSNGESEEMVGKALKAGATTSCWRRSSTRQWGMIPTSRADRAAGSSRPWRPR